MRRRLISICVSLLAFAALTPVMPANAITTWQGTVDWNDIRRTITGFGGSTAFGMADKVMQFPTAKRNEILDKLFSTSTGAGLSIIRLQIPNIKPTEAGGYNFTPDNYQAQFVDAAKLRATQKLMATAWSPPGWMKSNGNENGGGSLLPAYYQTYADYLAEYALRYQNRGTPLDVLSPANEPDAATNYPSCVWTGAEIRDFTKNNIISTWTNRGVSAQYMIPESSYWGESLALDTLNDATAQPRVNVVAAHGYANATNPARLTTAESHGKAIWQTEMSTLGATNDATIADGLVQAKRVHDFLTMGNVNAFNHWWLATTR